MCAVLNRPFRSKAAHSVQFREEKDLHEDMGMRQAVTIVTFAKLMFWVTLFSCKLGKQARRLRLKGAFNDLKVITSSFLNQPKTKNIHGDKWIRSVRTARAQIQA